MKILDVHDFHTGIKEIEETLSSQKVQVKDIQKSVQAVVDLDDAFKGKGGEAIRGLYRNKHLPMIEQYQTFLADYETTIRKLRNAIQDFEPAPHGVIKQSFLDHEVEDGLHRVKQTTLDMTNEANATIQRVSDIVSIPRIQDEDFLQKLANAQREKAQTVEKLYEFDRNQTASLSSLEEQVQDLAKQITMLQSVYRMGKVDIIKEKSTFKKKDSFLAELSDVAAAMLSKKYSKTLGTMEGVGLALFDIVMDTIESLLYLFTDPIGFFQGMFHALLHPIDTFKYVWGGIEQSFEEEVVQGDERSRERYVSYTATYIGASLYGLKGTDKVSAVSKTGRAGMVTKAGKKGSKKDIPYNVMATAAYKSLIKKGVTISFDIVEDTPKQLLSSKTGHQALTLNRVSKRLEENLIKTKNVLNSDAVKNVMEKTYQSVVRSAISKVARSEVFNGVRKLPINKNGHVKFSWKKEDRKSGTEGTVKDRPIYTNGFKIEPRYSSYEQRVKTTPVNKGKWSNERAESLFISDKTGEIKKYLDEAGVDGVEYKNGMPDFSPFSKGEVKLENMTNDRKANFTTADEELAKKWSTSEEKWTADDIADWREDNKYTWHELNDLETIQLVPSKINSVFKHLGGVGEYNIKVKLGE